MISAAEVLVVATPSWKRKGLRSAKDTEDGHGGAFEWDSAPFLALALVVRRMARGWWRGNGHVDDDDDGGRHDANRRESADAAIVLISFVGVGVAFDVIHKLK